MMSVFFHHCYCDAANVVQETQASNYRGQWSVEQRGMFNCHITLQPLKCDMTLRPPLCFGHAVRGMFVQMAKNRGGKK